jgi:hypothetical protein
MRATTTIGHQTVVASAKLPKDLQVAMIRDGEDSSSYHLIITIYPMAPFENISVPFPKVRVRVITIIPSRIYAGSSWVQ